MRDIDRDYYSCNRCGIQISAKTLEKRASRLKLEKMPPEADVLCRDCRDTAPSRKYVGWTHPVLGRIYCMPFQGELDEDWNPIDAKGRLYKPGLRLCGLKDCVVSAHIVAPDNDEPLPKREVDRGSKLRRNNNKSSIVQQLPDC